MGMVGCSVHSWSCVEGDPGRVLVSRSQIRVLLLQSGALIAAPASLDGVEVKASTLGASLGSTLEVGLALALLEAVVEGEVLLRVGVVRDAALLVAVASALLGAVLAADLALVSHSLRIVRTLARACDKHGATHRHPRRQLLPSGYRPPCE